MNEGEVVAYLRAHPECIEAMCRELVWTPMEYLRWRFASNIGCEVSIQKRTGEKFVRQERLHYRIKEAFDQLLWRFHGTSLRSFLSGFHELCGWNIAWDEKGIVFTHVAAREEIVCPFLGGWVSPYVLDSVEPAIESLADYDKIVMPYMERAWPIVLEFYLEHCE